jgi:hypothetical protein
MRTVRRSRATVPRMRRSNSNSSSQPTAESDCWLWRLTHSLTLRCDAIAAEAEVLPPTDPFDPFRQLKVQSGRPHRCSPARVRPMPSARAVLRASCTFYCRRRCMPRACVAAVCVVHSVLPLTAAGDDRRVSVAQAARRRPLHQVRLHCTAILRHTAPQWPTPTILLYCGALLAAQPLCAPARTREVRVEVLVCAAAAYSGPSRFPAIRAGCCAGSSRSVRTPMRTRTARRRCRRCSRRD